MSINTIMSVATNALRENAKVVADASSKIVQLPVTQQLKLDGVQGKSSSGLNVAGSINDNSFSKNRDAFHDEQMLTQIMRIKRAEIAYQASGILIRTAEEMSNTLLKAIA